MSTQLPLGERESERLEFKRYDATNPDWPAMIAREVAALLNSGGGELWIGIADREGVATHAEPLPDPGRVQGMIVDAIADRIEPRPGKSEIRFEVIDVPGVLRVTVTPRRDSTFAVRNRTSYAFPTRVHDHVRNRSWIEILHHAGSKERGNDAERARERLEAARRADRKAWQENEPVLRVLVFPIDSDVELDTRDERITAAIERGEGLDHIGSAMRTFTRSGASARAEKGGVIWSTGVAEPRPLKHLRVWRDGRILFRSGYLVLSATGVSPTPWPTLHSSVVIGFAVALFRLASLIYRDAHQAPRSSFRQGAVAALSIDGPPERWRLAPVHAQMITAGDVANLEPAALPVATSTMEFDHEALVERPDVCLRRLLEDLCTQLDLEKVPFFDESQRRFIVVP